MAPASEASGRASPTESVGSVQPTPKQEENEKKESGTIGTEPIDKLQPWRNIVQPEDYSQPDFFGDKPASKEESTKKIRLLAELDSKSR